MSLFLKIETISLNKKMHCSQNRIYCGDCNQSVLPSNYPNHLKSQGHVKNGSSNSLITKTHYKKR